MVEATISGLCDLQGAVVACDTDSTMEGTRLTRARRLLAYEAIIGQTG